ncbi:MAG TPA: hypothetical protein VMT22_07645 [Terriglobales bacterium]|jgi:hypothetical protein|nr:hypothetical protein [Terriglobales bacterium]
MGCAQNLQVHFGVTFRSGRLAPLRIAEEGDFKNEGLDVKQVNSSVPKVVGLKYRTWWIPTLSRNSTRAAHRGA